MPPKRGSGPPRATLPGVVRREELVRALYNRIAHPLPPIEPQVFDQDMARNILGETGYDIDRAEFVWRRHAARIRRERQAPPPPAPAVPAPSAPSAPSGLPAAPVQPDTTGNDRVDQPPTTPDSNSESESSGSDGGVEGAERPIKLKDELLTLLRKSMLPFSSGEQERRDAALALREAIKELHSITLSISEAVLLLQLDGWDLGVALAAFTSHDKARRRLRYHFDGLRDLADVEDEIQESKCLQVLAEITRRSDWLSLKLALERRKWNLVRTIISWFKKGIRVFKDNQIPREKRVYKGWGRRADRWGNPLAKPSDNSIKPANSDLSGWAGDGDDFADASTKDEEQPKPHIWGQEWRDDMEEAKKSPKARNRFIREYKGRQPGYLLNFNPKWLTPGAVAPSDFRLEWFQRGRYWMKIFNKSQFDFGRPGSPSESSSSSSQSSDSLGPSSGNSPTPPGQEAVKFDANNADHVAALNRWRTSTRWTAGQFTIHLRAQKWTQDELEKLYQLQSGRLAEYKREYPWVTRRDTLEKYFQMPKPKKNEWELDFNKQFEGAILAGEQFHRHARTIGGMLEHRARFPRLAIHFRIPLNNVYSKKLTDAEKQAIKEYEQQRDDLEAADEQATMDWIEANPTTDGKPRPLPPPKPVGNQPDRAKNKRKKQPSISPPATGGDNGGQDGGAGGSGGSAGASTIGGSGAGAANGGGSTAGNAQGRGRGAGRGRGSGRGGTGPPRRGGRGGSGDTAPRRGGRGGGSGSAGGVGAELLLEEAERPRVEKSGEKS